jgi:hypothetical protein
MDFTVDEKILNFIEPPPEKLAAMEQVRPDRFSITQLRTVVNELEELAKEFGDDQGGIPNKQICELFLRKLENSKSLWDEGSLPEEWWTLREYDFQNIVRNLDRAGRGAVDWRQLATFLILLKSPLPSDQDLESLRTAFGAGGLLDRQSFHQRPTFRRPERARPHLRRPQRAPILRDPSPGAALRQTSCARKHSEEER